MIILLNLPQTVIQCVKQESEIRTILHEHLFWTEILVALQFASAPNWI